MGSDSDQEKPGPPAEPPKSKHKRISAETAGETTNPQRSPQVAKPAPKKTTKSASAAERFKRGVVGEVVRDDDSAALLYVDPKTRRLNWTTGLESRTEVLIPRKQSAFEWLLPMASTFKRAYTECLTVGIDAFARALWRDAVACFRDAVVLADVRQYALLVAYALGTYFIEAFCHYPILYMWDLPDTGKTTAARPLVAVAHRGFFSTTVRPSYIARYAEEYEPLVCLDRENIESEMRNNGALDVLLGRTDRAMKIHRVLNYAKKDIESVTFYRTFGSTVLLTNSPIRTSALLSRCIRIHLGRGMPARRAEDADYLGLKARLLALRAEWMRGKISIERHPPRTGGLADGRLGDLVHPLHQMFSLFAPDRLGTLKSIAADLVRAQYEERQNSDQGQVVAALVKLRPKESASHLSVVDVSKTVRGIAGRTVSAKATAQVLWNLGFARGPKTKSGGTSVEWDSGRLQHLAEYYGLVPQPVTAQLPSTERSDLPDLSEVRRHLRRDDVIHLDYDLAGVKEKPE